MIDALYDSNRRVVISADGEPEEIYKKGDSAFEFKRCASRLHEMRSNEYIDSSRIYWSFKKTIVNTIIRLL